MTTNTLILGGAKSGKSAYALELAESLAQERIFVATAQAYDDEMHLRIQNHQAERGPSWRTVEEPMELLGTLRREDKAGRVILVDCLTLWLSNLMTQADLDEARIRQRGHELAQGLASLKAPVILVANEVGLGIVPDNPLARTFRDQAGALNQLLAQTVDRVVFVAAGLPLTLKGG